MIKRVKKKKTKGFFFFNIVIIYKASVCVLLFSSTVIQKLNLGYKFLLYENKKE